MRIKTSTQHVLSFIEAIERTILNRITLFTGPILTDTSELRLLFIYLSILIKLKSLFVGLFERANLRNNLVRIEKNILVLESPFIEERYRYAIKRHATTNRSLSAGATTGADKSYFKIKKMSYNNKTPTWCE